MKSCYNMFFENAQSSYKDSLMEEIVEFEDS